MFFTHAMYVCAANVRTGVEIGKKKGYVEECEAECIIKCVTKI